MFPVAVIRPATSFVPNKAMSSPNICFFVNVFDVHFSSFLFYTLSTCKSKFVSLEETCKTRARKTRCSRRANKLLCAARISPFSRKQTACYLSQNIRFNGSRKMRVSCLEARVSSLEMRLLSCEKRDEGW